jgi:hypothetical protein
MAKGVYPDGLIQLDLLLVILIRVEGVEADAVVDQLLPNLQNRKTSTC